MGDVHSAQGLTGKHYLLLLLLLLLLQPLLVAALNSAGAAEVTEIKWRPHAWDPRTRERVKPQVAFTDTLPSDEQMAMETICETVSSLPNNTHLLALSASAFHPALNTFCRAFNVTCVYVGASLGERVPDDWLHNAVRFYPAPELRSRSISEYISWAMWTKFAVLYSNFHDLESIHTVFNFHMGPVVFRRLDLDNSTSTLDALYHLKLSTMNHFILDLPQSEMLKFTELAHTANLEGLARSFLLIREMNSTFFKEKLASRVWSAMNLTSHLFQDVNLLKDVDSGVRQWKKYNKTAALDTLLDLAYIKWESKTSRNVRLLASADSEMQDCGELSMSDTTGEFYEIFKRQIERRVGTVSIDGLKHYNFSFNVDHLNTVKNTEFASWTADGGYALFPGADNRHQRHLREFLKELNLKVVTVIDPPFSFVRNFNEDGQPLYGNDRWSGFSIELFKMVASTLNVSYTIRLSSDGQFGSPTLTESGEQVWSGTIGDLMSGAADVAVASLVITYDREMVIDFTTPYMSLGLSVIMKRPEQKTDPLQFMLPFSSQVWLYMMFAWLLTSFIMFLCARLSPYEWYSHSDCVPVVENQFGALNSMWFTIGSLMQQGSDLAPRASSTRMVGTSWWFFTLLLISSYTANLAAFLTSSRLGAIESVDDLADQSKVTFGCATGGAMYNFFKNSRIPLYKKMWESMVTWSAKNKSFVRKTTEGIRRVRRGGYAYILESTFNQYYRERDCDLIQIGGIFNPGSYAFAVSQGNTILRDELSEVILKLHKEQFIERLSDNWMKRFNLTGPPCSEDSQNAIKSGTLDVVSFGGVFISMLIGFAIAIAICVLELLWRSGVLSARTGRPFLSLCREQLCLAAQLTVNKKPPPNAPTAVDNAADCDL